MALRGPHKRMKTEGRRIFAYCMAVLPHPDPSGGQAPRLAKYRATFSHSAIDHPSTIRHVSPVESRHRG